MAIFGSTKIWVPDPLPFLSSNRSLGRGGGRVPSFVDISPWRWGDTVAHCGGTVQGEEFSTEAEQPLFPVSKPTLNERLEQ